MTTYISVIAIFLIVAVVFRLSLHPGDSGGVH